MEMECGDAGALDTQGTGWFVGFGPWTRRTPEGVRSLRYVPSSTPSTGLSMKWMTHPAGDPRGTGKPVSVGRTLSIMVVDGGRFCLELSEQPEFAEDATQRVVLERAGQFCAWGAGVYHRYTVEAESTILTLRWVPTMLG